jgi:hypothetical protein
MSVMYSDGFHGFQPAINALRLSHLIKGAGQLNLDSLTLHHLAPRAFVSDRGQSPLLTPVAEICTFIEQFFGNSTETSDSNK